MDILKIKDVCIFEDSESYFFESYTKKHDDLILLKSFTRGEVEIMDVNSYFTNGMIKFTIMLDTRGKIQGFLTVC